MNNCSPEFRCLLGLDLMLLFLLFRDLPRRLQRLDPVVEQLPVLYVTHRRFRMGQVVGLFQQKVTPQLLQ